jgi:hypothetical protein
MCDYSLQSVRSRPAKVDDRLITRDFGTGTRGFACRGDRTTAVCLLPGTELAFERPVTGREPLLMRAILRLLGRPSAAPTYRTAIFRQINKDCTMVHHDALEFPDGKVVLLTHLAEGQRATVLQLPAAPRTREEAASQHRVPIHG